MEIKRILLAAAAVALFVPLAAQAQEFPSKPITLVVPYPPGGSADLIGRVLADKLGNRLGQAIVVENRGGAAGAIGSESVARANADGYTLLIGISDTHAIGPAVNPALPYDAEADFAPVSLLAIQPLNLAVGATSGITSLAEFVERAKADPGKVTYASNGIGGIQHLAMELFSTQAGIETLHIPYPGAGPAITDVIGGHVNGLFISYQAAGSHIEAGNLTALAVSSEERLDALPDTPTFAEAGFAEFQANQWYGLFAPAGTPEDIVQKLAEESAAVMSDTEVAQPLLDAGTRPIGGTPQEFTTFLGEQIGTWKGVAQQANIKLD
jgi:tripartite-type tricarboxylate transporter receptor subunit TctC